MIAGVVRPVLPVPPQLAVQSVYPLCYCTRDSVWLTVDRDNMRMEAPCLVKVSDCRSGENCVACTSPTGCTKCVSTMLLYKGQCVAHCGQGQYEDGSTMSCKGK